MTKRYLKDWAYSKIVDYQLTSKAFGSMALSERRSCARRFKVSPAGSVVALCIMREWLSGGAPPCQGGGRGFDPRLALFFVLGIKPCKNKETES